MKNSDDEEYLPSKFTQIPKRIYDKRKTRQDKDNCEIPWLNLVPKAEGRTLEQTLDRREEQEGTPEGEKQVDSSQKIRKDKT